ncbi:hypothetical protein C0J52_09604 [Blattella germanica]|nr:hypothetical protein C0J52_09604 [Blattella germanica]
MASTSSSTVQSTGEEGPYTANSTEHLTRDNSRSFNSRGTRGSGSGRNKRKLQQKPQKEKSVPGPISTPIKIDPKNRPTAKSLAIKHQN